MESKEQDAAFVLLFFELKDPLFQKLLTIFRGDSPIVAYVPCMNRNLWQM